MKNKFKLTVEQLTVFFKMVVLDKKNTGITEANVKEALEKVYALTTLEQVKQLARNYNADLIQWVDFDSNDKKTWPQDKDWSSFVEYSNGNIEMCHNQDLLQGFSIGCFNSYGISILRIAEIPQPKRA